MLLLFKLLPEKNEPDEKEIDRKGNRRMPADLPPGFLHFRGPVNIVKYEHRVVMDFGEALTEIMQGGFLTMITIQKGKVKAGKRFQYRRQRFLEVARDDPDLCKIKTCKSFLCDARCFRASLHGNNAGSLSRGHHISGGQSERSAQLEDILRLKIIHEAEKQL